MFSFSYVSLCDNEKTGCKARELKSVYVDAVGQFLKLILHQNHVNKFNIHNQVWLKCLHFWLPTTSLQDHIVLCLFAKAFSKPSLKIAVFMREC